MSSALGSIDPHEAERRLSAGAVLVDVREADEWAAGHAPQARHIPLGQLKDRRGELPTEGGLILVCRSGGRSQRAQEELNHHGITAANLDGGMRAWDEAGLPVHKDDGTGGRVI